MARKIIIFCEFFRSYSRNLQARVKFSRQDIIVNDVTERRAASIGKYNESLTKNEELLERLLQMITN